MELWYTHTHCVWCSININLSNSQRNISQVSFALPFWFSALFAAASSVLAKGVTISALGCLGSGVMMRSSPALPALSYQRLEKNSTIFQVVCWIDIGTWPVLPMIPHACLGTSGTSSTHCSSWPQQTCENIWLGLTGQLWNLSSQTYRF